jgi:predicted Zn-dependent protease
MSLETISLTEQRVAESIAHADSTSADLSKHPQKISGRNRFSRYAASTIGIASLFLGTSCSWLQGTFLPNEAHAQVSTQTASTPRLKTEKHPKSFREMSRTTGRQAQVLNQFTGQSWKDQCTTTHPVYDETKTLQGTQLSVDIVIFPGQSEAVRQERIAQIKKDFPSRAESLSKRYEYYLGIKVNATLSTNLLTAPRPAAAYEADDVDIFLEEMYNQHPTNTTGPVYTTQWTITTEQMNFLSNGGTMIDHGRMTTDYTVVTKDPQDTEGIIEVEDENIAHELGHGFGLVHTNTPRSLMNIYRTGGESFIYWDGEADLLCSSESKPTPTPVSPTPTPQPTPKSGQTYRVIIPSSAKRFDAAFQPRSE